MANEKDLRDSERGFIVGAQMAGASVAAQLACVSTEKVTEVTSAFRAKGRAAEIEQEMAADSTHLMTAMLENYCHMKAKTEQSMQEAIRLSVHLLLLRDIVVGL